MVELSVKVILEERANMRFDLHQEFSGLVIILGANAAGKTSFLQAIHGNHGGEVFWDGKAASASKSKRGFVNQNPQMLQGTVRRNLRIAAELLGFRRAKIGQQIDDLTQSSWLKQSLDRSTATLSTGQIAQMALLRAQLGAPKILLLDEVTANLDQQNTRTFETMLKEFTQKPDHLAFFVTHSLSQARRLADQVIFFHDGDILFAGDAQKFWESDQLPVVSFLQGEL